MFRIVDIIIMHLCDFNPLLYGMIFLFLNIVIQLEYRHVIEPLELLSVIKIVLKK